MEIYTINQDKMRPNSKIVAFFCDGSGAEIFKVDDGRNIIELSEYNKMTVDDLEDAGFCSFAYLPDDFRLWREENESRDN